MLANARNKNVIYSECQRRILINQSKLDCLMFTYTKINYSENVSMF